MSLKKTNVAAKKGGAPLEPFTVDLARRIVGEVIDRVEEERMARRKKSDEDEIDALVEGLDEEVEDEDEDVEEVEDDDEAEGVEEADDDDDEEDDEEEDPDEAPAKKGRSKSKSAKAKKERTGIGTKEVAEEAGVDQRTLRMYLRAQGFQPRDDRDGRYEWKSLNDKEVQRILKGIKSGEVKKMNKERLDDLKGKKKSTAKKTDSKSTKKRRKARSAS